MPAVVFVTAYDEYALRAFEIHALDYLLKPFSAERFRSALTHAREQLAQRRRRDSARPPARGALTRRRAAAARRRDRLVVKSSGRIYFVRTADIDWCEAAGNYVRLHVGDAVAPGPRDDEPPRVAARSPQFVRIHRSTIVNVDRIQELRSSFNGEYIVVLQRRHPADAEPRLPRGPPGTARQGVLTEVRQPARLARPPFDMRAPPVA